MSETLNIAPRTLLSAWEDTTSDDVQWRRDARNFFRGVFHSVNVEDDSFEDAALLYEIACARYEELQ